GGPTGGVDARGDRSRFFGTGVSGKWRSRLASPNDKPAPAGGPRRHPPPVRSRSLFERHGAVKHRLDEAAINQLYHVVEFFAGARVRAKQGGIAQQKPGRIIRDGAVVELADKHVAPADGEGAKAGGEHRLADVVAAPAESGGRNRTQLVVEALAARDGHHRVGTGGADRRRFARRASKRDDEGAGKLRHLHAVDPKPAASPGDEHRFACLDAADLTDSVELRADRAGEHAGRLGRNRARYRRKGVFAHQRKLGICARAIVTEEPLIWADPLLPGAAKVAVAAGLAI